MCVCVFFSGGGGGCWGGCGISGGADQCEDPGWHVGEEVMHCQKALGFTGVWYGMREYIL